MPNEQLTYIRQDIEVPSQLYERQQEAIATQDLARVVFLEHLTLPAVAAMEIRGIIVDLKRWRTIIAIQVKQKEALEAHIQQILGNALACVQPKQDGLFREKGQPVVCLTSFVQLTQSTNADILKSALILPYRQLPCGVHVVLTVHDEIVLECPDERVASATHILKGAMVQACREYLKVVCSRT